MDILEPAPPSRDGLYFLGYIPDRPPSIDSNDGYLALRDTDPGSLRIVHPMSTSPIHTEPLPPPAMPALRDDCRKYHIQRPSASLSKYFRQQVVAEAPGGYAEEAPRAVQNAPNADQAKGSWFERFIRKKRSPLGNVRYPFFRHSYRPVSPITPRAHRTANSG
jgi:hypothetical protein